MKNTNFLCHARYHDIQKLDNPWMAGRSAPAIVRRPTHRIAVQRYLTVHQCLCNRQSRRQASLPPALLLISLTLCQKSLDFFGL